MYKNKTFYPTDLRRSKLITSGFVIVICVLKIIKRETRNKVTLLI